MQLGDKLNKCILFELLLYSFTQNIEYINPCEDGSFNYLYLSIIFCAFPFNFTSHGICIKFHN